MFSFLGKAKDEVAAVTTAVKEPTPKFVKVLTLPEVVEHYVSTNKDTTNDDFTEINDQISKNKRMIDFLRTEERKAYDNEKSIYCDKRRKFEETNDKLKLQKIEATQQMEANKIGYQKIDLSFLSMRRPVKGKLTSFHPVFSAHKYTGSGFIECVIEVDSYGVDVSNENFVPSVAVMKHLFKVFIPDLDEKDIVAGYGRINYRNRDNSRKSIEIETSFKGIIPATTKEKIKKAEETFSDKNHGIFLIKECPVWQESEITKDPLIIGVIGDQAYLIDKFDCTALEDYVKAEFTE
jgi:hypothetical protein